VVTLSLLLIIIHCEIATLFLGPGGFSANFGSCLSFFAGTSNSQISSAGGTVGDAAFVESWSYKV
jgi:hypothetical protein